MGSLENGFSLKMDHRLLHSLSGTGRSFNEWQKATYGQRQLRSRFAKLVFLKKIDCLTWICTVAVFLFFLVLFQMLLPGSIVDKCRDFLKMKAELGSVDFSIVKEFGGFDFGEDIKFEPSKLLAKFLNDDIQVNGSIASRRVLKFGHRKPRLAMVFTNLLVGAYQIQMATISAALRKIGYEIEVLSVKMALQVLFGEILDFHSISWNLMTACR